MPFPKDFTFGAAAAAYQIEGAVTEGDRGRCVWDMHSHIPGRVFGDHNGDVACDHYHRYKDDIGLMKEVGLQAYRFSISWPRVIPSGTGAINAEGLDFYDSLVDELLAKGIQPWATLFHWDFPHELFLRGGWLNPDSPKWFADYTAVVVDRLSDRVSHWMTLNEPQVFIGLGHMTGDHAPGIAYGRAEWLRVIHHVLLAHGLGTRAIRANAKSEAQVGFVPAAKVDYPVTESAADIEAARKATFATGDSAFNTSWYMDPVIFGEYPEDGLELFGKDAPAVGPDDMAIIGEPVDFFGHNHYCGVPVRATDNEQGWESVPHGPNHPLTAFRWAVTPESLYWSCRWFSERYKLPIIITENGLSSMDWVSVDGKVHDPGRIDFLTRYLRATHRAIEDGADVRGYLQWSIFDNFEWAEGYKERFGLIYVNYETQERILKDSAHWYSEVIASRGENLLSKPEFASEHS